MRKRRLNLSRFELEIMDLIWRLESGSVREIQEQLPEKDRPAYTTIQTIVRRLEEKGAVRRTRKVGNAYIFEPAISRETAHKRLVADLLGFFGGSALPLMAHLVEAGKLSLADIREIESLLQKKQDERVNKGGESRNPAGRDGEGSTR